jgi:hypothetical protein
MVPAPPVLVPPQGRAARVFDADVSGNPFQIVRAKGPLQKAYTLFRGQNDSHDGVVPPEGKKGVVRARAS